MGTTNVSQVSEADLKVTDFDVVRRTIQPALEAKNIACEGL